MTTHSTKVASAGVVRVSALSFRQWSLLLVAGLLYYAAAHAGMAVFAMEPSNISLLWLPSGIGMVMCIYAGWRAVPVVFLASLAANFPGMISNDNVVGQAMSVTVMHVLIAAGVDAFSVRFAAALKLLLVPSLNRVRDLFVFGVYACLLPIGVGVLILCVNLYAGGFLSLQSAYQLFAPLLAADLLGVLLIVPLADRLWHTTTGRWSSLLASLPFMAISVAIVAIGFNWIPGAIYLVVPLLLYVVVRQSSLHMLYCLPVVVIAILAFAAVDLGPFNLADREQGLLMMKSFLLITVLTLHCFMLHLDVLTSTQISRDSWQKRAHTDSLSELANRDYFMPQLNIAMEQASTSKLPTAIAMIDIDHFKAINDTWGHLNGDHAIRLVSRLMREGCRSHDLPCRMGGEEFAILLPKTSGDTATKVMERLRKKIAATPVSLKNGEQFHLTASVGVIEITAAQKSADQVLDKADAALYKAKSMGRNNVHYAH